MKAVPLKPPVWTWEVPAYFFTGGLAGAAAVIGGLARDGQVRRRAHALAAAATAASTPLLVSDLGRPERFHHMLRVVKLSSPMSAGAWTLLAFSGATGATLLPWRAVASLGSSAAVPLGAVMSTYTGVLIGATAVPVWNRHRVLLPIAFGSSSLAAASGVLVAWGQRDRGLRRLLGVGAAAETAAALAEKGTPRRLRATAFAAGAVPLGLLALRRPRLAGVAAAVGSLLLRYEWIRAGRNPT